MFLLLIRLSALVLVRYLSLEENALRKLPGASSGAAEGERTSEDGEDSSEDEDEGFGVGLHGDGGGSAGSVVSMGAFLRRRHEAYKSPVMIVLEGMMDFTHEQFQSNLVWIVPLLSRLVICEDLEVRLCVRQIYQSFVNFLLIR